MKADLIIFAGQSNMAGRGDFRQAPKVTEGAGWEFRPVTDPSRLYPVIEPFGKRENREGGINDTDRKSGSLVSAFVNACYAQTGVPIVGVSASEGGTGMEFWRPLGPAFADLKSRILSAGEWLEENGFVIRRKVFLWMQGETDGDHHMSGEEYKKRLGKLFDEVKALGITDLFLIPIGCYNGDSRDIEYETVHAAQLTLCRERDDVRAVSLLADTFRERGMMRDAYHYRQQAYNELGEDAGKNAGIFLRE